MGGPRAISIGAPVMPVIGCERHAADKDEAVARMGRRLIQFAFITPPGVAR